LRLAGRDSVWRERAFQAVAGNAPSFAAAEAFGQPSLDEASRNELHHDAPTYASWQFAQGKIAILANLHLAKGRNLTIGNPNVHCCLQHAEASEFACMAGQILHKNYPFDIMDYG
jgi:hypothetical protein